jgi:hypothetical protein
MRPAVYSFPLRGTGRHSGFRGKWQELEADPVLVFECLRELAGEDIC